MDDMKPAQISKELKLPVDFIYKTLDKYKKDQQRQTQENIKQSEKKVVKSQNPILIDAIMTLLDRDGIYGIKLKQLRLQLLEMIPEEHVLSESRLSHILRTKFKLKYKKLEKANVKYSDPQYNEKRLWISKLLT